MKGARTNSVYILFYLSHHTEGVDTELASILIQREIEKIKLAYLRIAVRLIGSIALMIWVS